MYTVYNAHAYNDKRYYEIANEAYWDGASAQGLLAEMNCVRSSVNAVSVGYGSQTMKTVQ